MRHLVFAFGCAATSAAAEVPQVAVDIAPVHSIVAAVMGDLGSPALVVPPGASPHDHALRPSEARSLNNADIVIWMGPQLAPWLARPIESLAGQAAVIDLLAHPTTELLDIRSGATFGAHDHDHGHKDDDGYDDAHDHDAEHDDNDDHEHDHDKARDHDDHGHDDAHGHDDDHDKDHADAHRNEQGGAVDPHAWLDPVNAMAWASAIGDALATVDPENAATYAANAEQFSLKINAVKGEIETILEPVKGRSFVVFHDAYHYFEHRFDVEASGAVSSNDAAAPSAARLSELRAEIAALGAVCALTEPQFNPAILDALGPVTLGEVDPIGVNLEPGPDLYPQLLSNMAMALANCLK